MWGNVEPEYKRQDCPLSDDQLAFSNLKFLSPEQRELRKRHFDKMEKLAKDELAKTTPEMFWDQLRGAASHEKKSPTRTTHDETNSSSLTKRKSR